MAVVVNDDRPVDLLAFQPHRRPAGSQPDPMLDDAGVPQSRLDGDAAAEDLVRNLRIRLEVPVVLDGDPAEDHDIAMRDDSGPRRSERRLHEHPVDAGVLDHHVLTANRADGQVRYQLARAEAGTVGDQRRQLGGIRERASS